jgi:hypothetical protein
MDGSRCGDTHSIAIPPACFGVAFHKSGAPKSAAFGHATAPSWAFVSSNPSIRKQNVQHAPSLANHPIPDPKPGKRVIGRHLPVQGGACKARCRQSVGLQPPPLSMAPRASPKADLDATLPCCPWLMAGANASFRTLSPRARAPTPFCSLSSNLVPPFRSLPSPFVALNVLINCSI